MLRAGSEWALALRLWLQVEVHSGGHVVSEYRAAIRETEEVMVCRRRVLQAAAAAYTTADAATAFSCTTEIEFSEAERRALGSYLLCHQFGMCMCMCIRPGRGQATAQRGSGGWV